MSDRGRMRLGAYFNPTGHHVASWRHPRSQKDAHINIRHYVEIAQTAERAKFDMIFFADNMDMQQALQLVQARVNEARTDLPPDTDIGRRTDQRLIQDRIFHWVLTDKSELYDPKVVIDRMVHPFDYGLFWVRNFDPPQGRRPKRTAIVFEQYGEDLFDRERRGGAKGPPKTKLL